MTDRVVRLQALVLAILVFFVTWVLIAAHPWKETSAPAPAAVSIDGGLAAYEQQLARTSALADLLAQRRANRAATLAAPLPPRIVTIPAVTATRTS